MQNEVACSVGSYLGEIKSVGSQATNKALDKVKAGLYSVKVSRCDATQLQREIEGELFDKWHEGCEVRERRKIPGGGVHSPVFWWGGGSGGGGVPPKPYNPEPI